MKSNRINPYLFALSKVTDRLYVSSLWVARNLTKANPEGITAVLNLTEVDYQENPDIIYMRMSIEDGQPISREMLFEILDYLRFIYENGHKILIHCAAGASRSPSIMAAFMHYMKIEHYLDAMDKIVEARPIVDPAWNLVKSMKEILQVWPYGAFE